MRRKAAGLAKQARRQSNQAARCRRARTSSAGGKTKRNAKRATRRYTRHYRRNHQ